MSPWPPSVILALYVWGCVVVAWFMIAIASGEPGS